VKRIGGIRLSEEGNSDFGYSSRRRENKKSHGYEQDEERVKSTRQTF
jgi:hypothetical protein